jgi:hypothetical protein
MRYCTSTTRSASALYVAVAKELLQQGDISVLFPKARCRIVAQVVQAQVRDARPPASVAEGAG